MSAKNRILTPGFYVYVYVQLMAAVSVVQESSARGVYPYLPMATNAPWSILGGGGEKSILGGNEKV